MCWKGGWANSIGGWVGGFGGLRWVRKVCDIGSNCSCFAQARNNSSWVPDEVRMPFGMHAREYNHSNTNADHEAGGIDTAGEGRVVLHSSLAASRRPSPYSGRTPLSVDNHLPIGQQDRQIMNLWFKLV